MNATTDLTAIGGYTMLGIAALLLTCACAMMTECGARETLRCALFVVRMPSRFFGCLG